MSKLLGSWSSGVVIFKLKAGLFSRCHDLNSGSFYLEFLKACWAERTAASSANEHCSPHLLYPEHAPSEICCERRAIIQFIYAAYFITQISSFSQLPLHRIAVADSRMLASLTYPVAAHIFAVTYPAAAYFKLGLSRQLFSCYA